MFDVFYSKGPDFLFAYFILGLFSVLGYLIYRNSYLNNDQARSQADSYKEDPYFLSYLQGGEVVVMKLALWSLSLKKAVKLEFSRMKTSARFTYEKTPRGLNPVESLILGYLEKVGGYSDFKDFLLSETIRTEVKNYMLHQYKFLEHSKLYLSETKRKHLKDVRTGIFFILIGIAAVKIVIAISNGHTNVLFLILMCGGFLFLLSIIKKEKATSSGENIRQCIKKR